MLHQARGRQVQEATTQDDTCSMLLPDQATGLAGKRFGEGEVSAEKQAGRCSVPRGPIALGDRVRDFQESGAHQAEGFVRERRHVVRCHPLCLNLWKDL